MGFQEVVQFETSLKAQQPTHLAPSRCGLTGVRRVRKLPEGGATGRLVRPRVGQSDSFVRLLVEKLAEIHLNGGASGAVDSVGHGDAVLGGVDVAVACLGVNQPDPFDTELEVVVDSGFHATHTVLGGEDFDYEEGRFGQDSARGPVAFDDGDIGEADSGCGNSGTDFGDGEEVELAAAGEEPGTDGHLNRSMVDLTHIHLHQFAIDELAVAIFVRSCEVFFGTGQECLWHCGRPDFTMFARIARCAISGVDTRGESRETGSCSEDCTFR